MAPMDDFKVVLGIDFLWNFKVVPLSFLRSKAILEEKTSCIVPMVIKSSPKAPLLSAMQVKKGLKMNEVTYLATLMEDKKDALEEPMPKAIEGVFDEFKDVILLKLPKRLPPRRKEDHKIKLKLRSKPLAMGQCRMAPLELKELKRWPKELLDVVFIQPSKASYDMSMLFQKKHDGSLWMCTNY